MVTPTYVFGDEGTVRLEAVEAFLDPGTIRHLEYLGVVPALRCLEVGAGGGSIARWLVAQGASVVATELDTINLEPFAGRSLEVRRHNIVEDPLEENAFHLAHARLVLEHLPDRRQALDKMIRALKPGGWLLIEDVDYVSGIPISELGAAEHAHTQNVRLQEFARVGVDHTLGRRLPALLREAGLEDVGNEGRVFVMEGGSPGANWFKLSMQRLRPRLVGSNKLTDAEVDRMLALFDDPAWSAFSPIILAAWGRKPMA